jgi:hypothetical protein
MKVIAHQPEPQHLHIGALAAIDQKLNKRLKIGRLAKDLLPVVPAVEHMIHHPTHSGPCGSRAFCKPLHTCGAPDQPQRRRFPAIF